MVYNPFEIDRASDPLPTLLFKRLKITIPQNNTSKIYDFDGQRLCFTSVSATADFATAQPI